MANKILVKVNSVGNLTDARYFAAHDVEWMGYCFDPSSPNFIQLPTAKGIIDWVVGPKVVAEFSNQPHDEIQQVIEYTNPDFVQLPSTFSISDFNFLKPLMVQISFSEIRNIESELMKWKDRANIFILNADYRAFSSDDLKTLSLKFQFLISSTGADKNILPAIQHSGAIGIYIDGGSEEKTGIKNYEEMDELFESIRAGISNT